MTYISPTLSRCSAEAAYLTPAVLARQNLTVATNAHVTKILFEGKRAVGVEFSRNKEAPCYQARARKEVILRYVHPNYSLIMFNNSALEVLERFTARIYSCILGSGLLMN
jgi:ribosome biogenesis SPOUT family RNA methylase Rps3